MLKIIFFLCLVTYASCHESIPGGYEDADVKDEYVLVAANHASESLSKQFSSSYHHKLVRVLKAKTQVVAGTNYKLDLIVGLTNCKKSEVLYQNINGCKTQNGISAYKKCQVIVYENLEGEFQLTSSGCILASKKDL